MRKSREITWKMPAGSSHFAWKGEEASYSSKHKWVRYHFGKPTRCEDCGSQDKRLNWANISGKYFRKREDWKTLCVNCHRVFDGVTHKLLFKENCKHGHRLTIDKLVLTRRKAPRANNIQCRECIQERGRKHRANKKAKSATANN